MNDFFSRLHTWDEWIALVIGPGVIVLFGVGYIAWRLIRRHETRP